MPITAGSEASPGDARRVKAPAGIFCCRRQKQAENLIGTMELSLFVWCLLAALAFISIFQFLYVWNFWSFLCRPTPSAWALPTDHSRPTSGTEIDAGSVPRVGVILCIRGLDPTLQRCLVGLTRQSFSNFRVICVVDHPTDPALELVQQIAAGDSRIELSVVENPPRDRGLKCNALLQAASTLREDCELLALVDADVDVDEHWLRDLVAPFADEQIGLVSGNRWFLASDRRTGSLVRMIWNAAALPQMLAYKIPWGGSLAMRISAADAAQVFQRWQTTVFDDVLLGPAIESAGFKIAQLPGLFMGNDETCDVRGACRWMIRQLLDTRLYHWSWTVVAAHGFNSFAVFLFSLFVLGLELVSIRWLGVAVSSLAISAFWLQNACLLRMMEQRVIAKVEHRKSTKESRLGWMHLFWLMPLTQAIHFWATLRAALATHLHWRGISYRFRGPDKIQMLDYVPYAETGRQNEEHESV